MVNPADFGSDNRENDDVSLPARSATKDDKSGSASTSLGHASKLDFQRSSASFVPIRRCDAGAWCENSDVP